MLRVVGRRGDQPPMLGDYAVDGDARSASRRCSRSIPAAHIDVALHPAASGRRRRRVTASVGLPADATRRRSTVVAQVYPDGDVVPENQLRLYIHFSAPMGLKGGLDYVQLLDEHGHRRSIDPFLPLDAEFWNDDRTRYTVFFDPGRQKRGILPNQRDGTVARRQAVATRSSSSREWRDGNGLAAEGGVPAHVPRRSADERPLDVNGAGRSRAPPRGTRDAADGDVSRAARSRPAAARARRHRRRRRSSDRRRRAASSAGETRWTFTPRDAVAGRHVSARRAGDARGSRRQPHRPRVRSRSVRSLGHSRLSRRKR